MEELTRDGEPAPLTPDWIKDRTGYELLLTFPDFSSSGRISPDLHEQRESFALDLGEDNVLSSFYVDEAEVVQLGLFVRRQEPQQHFID